MATLLLVLVVVLVVAGLAFGVISLLSGDDPGLVPATPDGYARPLPGDRALIESDVKHVRFDVALRGYRMDEVDFLIRRVAHDIGYKNEVIAVLEAEVDALREGRSEDAELLRKARDDAARPALTGLPATEAELAQRELARSDEARSDQVRADVAEDAAEPQGADEDDFLERDRAAGA